MSHFLTFFVLCFLFLGYASASENKDWIGKYQCLTITDDNLATAKLMVSCDGYEWPGDTYYLSGQGYGLGCIIVTGNNSKITYELPADAEDCELSEGRPETIVLGKKQ